ncbi:MAG: hypothetical protein HZB54_03690 [Deltaproteobacteria bacterium]|nr:hypothetical protein [Deltaproteobacteria bacterium]
MKRSIIFSFAFVASLFMTATCFSDNGRLGMYGYSNERADDASFFIGERTWQSIGDDKWNIAGTGSGGPPNILSELEYLGLTSTIYEIYGGIRAGRGAIHMAYGFGSLYGGIYRDSDYLRDDRQGIYSLSTGTAESKEWNALYYWNIDYTYRILTNDQEEKFNEIYLDMLVGYQLWHEKITMANGVQEYGGTLGPFAGLNSTYEFIWKSVRLGLEGGIPIYKGFALKGSTIFIPYTQYEGEGIWNLRTTGVFALKQSPSFTHSAKGGYGAQLEAFLVYHIHPAFTMGVGYRYWYIKSGKGDDITYFSDGTTGITQFNEAVNERQGYFLDISYIF